MGRDHEEPGMGGEMFGKRRRNHGSHGFTRINSAGVFRCLRILVVLASWPGRRISTHTAACLYPCRSVLSVVPSLFLLISPCYADSAATGDELVLLPSSAR